jgi:hypothetical protein
VATLFAVLATSTIVQISTALAIGTFEGYRWGWSTGGFIALIASNIMLIMRVVDWAAWWRRMWPWLVVTAVLAFGVMVAAYQPSAATHGLPDEPSFRPVSEWEKVDEPARRVTEATGEYYVLQTEISPCYVGQGWGHCIDKLIVEYEYACIGNNLTANSERVCESYKDEIVDMQSRGSPGSTVATLGGGGTLTLEPHSSTRTLPVVSHVAVCYFGSFGECS